MPGGYQVRTEEERTIQGILLSAGNCLYQQSWAFLALKIKTKDIIALKKIAFYRIQDCYTVFSFTAGNVQGKLHNFFAVF